MMQYPCMMSRRRANAYGSFKAEVFRNSNADLFIESSPTQAREIALITRLPVLCLETHEMLYGGSYTTAHPTPGRGTAALAPDTDEPAKWCQQGGVDYVMPSYVLRTSTRWRMWMREGRREACDTQSPHNAVVRTVRRIGRVLWNGGRLVAVTLSGASPRARLEAAHRFWVAIGMLTATLRPRETASSKANGSKVLGDGG
jgi:hypothetical protein